jgi:hypothetical protein
VCTFPRSAISMTYANSLSDVRDTKFKTLSSLLSPGVTLCKIIVVWKEHYYFLTQTTTQIFNVKSLRLSKGENDEKNNSVSVYEHTSTTTIINRFERNENQIATKHRHRRTCCACVQHNLVSMFDECTATGAACRNFDVLISMTMDATSTFTSSYVVVSRIG